MDESTSFLLHYGVCMYVDGNLMCNLSVYDLLAMYADLHMKGNDTCIRLGLMQYRNL